MEVSTVEATMIDRVGSYHDTYYIIPYDMLFFIGLPLLLIGYFIGSIPFGLILTKLFGNGDIRNIGSGNIGATNVLRTGNKKLAIFTLLFDVAKGAIACQIYFFIGILLTDATDIEIPFKINEALILGFFAILGHCFPIWLKFKGGKGVATTFGVLLAAVPYAGLAACCTWLLSAFLSRISSLSALIATAVAPIMTFFIYGAQPAVICTFISLLVWMRHKDNIKRLINGTEPKIGERKNEESRAPVSE